MSKEIEQGSDSATPQAESDVVVLIKKMQQQLTALEKKIDILMSRPKENSFAGKRFSRPFHSSGPSRHHERGEYRHGAGERSYDKREPYRGREGREGDSRGKDFGQGHHFEKKHYSSERPRSDERPRSEERPRSGGRSGGFGGGGGGRERW